VISNHEGHEERKDKKGFSTFDSSYETSLNLHPLLVGAASSREKKLLASYLDSYHRMIAAGSRSHSL
jgi:hypothetical protein